MNAQNYTQQSLEAVQNAQSIANEHGHQQIEPPHLPLARLLDDSALRLRMGRAARAACEQSLGYERFYARYLTIYA